MTSDPASSSRPAIRVRTNEPWWTNNFRSSFGARRHELQSQSVARSMLRRRRRKRRSRHRWHRAGATRSARPSSTNRNAASPSNLASRNGGSRRPTIVSSRSPAIVGACSISLFARYGGVAGQVRQDEEAGLGRRCHGRDARPWSHSNVKTLDYAAGAGPGGTIRTMPNRLAQRDQSVPAPAREQPGRLVPVGPRCARRGPRSSIARSSSRSAMPRATGATSWSASRSRTRTRPRR